MSDEMILILCQGDREFFLDSVEEISIKLGKAFIYPVYRGKNSPILGFGCEILKKKNT